MKIYNCLLGHFLIPVLMGLASLSFIRCTCQPNFEAPKDQTIDPKKDTSDKPDHSDTPDHSDKPGTPDNSGNPNSPDKPNKPLLTEITDDMIQAAGVAGKHFLADQLRKLQKEERTNAQVAYINDVDPGGGGAALHAAVDSFLAQPDIVRALLERGADPNQLVNGQSPLYTAVSCMPENNLDNIRLLLDAGANPTLGGGEYCAIYTAIKWSQDTALPAVELMLTKVTDINKQYDQGNTILHCSVDVQAPKIVALLLAKSADFTIRNDAGGTAKEIAQRRNPAVKNQFN